MDQFIGEPGLWNQGIGSQLVKETAVFLLTVKRADKIVMDPQS
ncbi:acetyltransferase [Paenibacillus jilunlii]|nr:acetyltransferase [Paenibacillus jilunlii]